MLEAINYIATALSIIGGCIAIWQASIASTEATKAEKYRNEIVSTRQAIDFSGIDIVLNRAITLISKYGPASSPLSLLGASPQKDAEEVQHFITTIKRNKSLFEGYYKEIDDFCGELSKLIADLVSEHPSNPNTIKEIGTKLYHRLTDFSPVLKGKLDHLRERPPQ